MEIERKFLVNSILEIDLNLEEYICKTIIQDYLYVDKLTVIRKRKIKVNDNIKYFYTIKTGKKGISVNEIENEIDEETYKNLNINSDYNTIIKKRYIIPYINDLTIELDVFEGIYTGLIFAEIEYKDENQANEIEIPKWFGKEISTIVTNSDMAIKSREKILTILKK